MQTRHAQADSEYAKIVEQVHTFLADERDLIANAANLSALLFEALEAVDWAGFYFLREGKFVLGPFQGHAVKSRLPLVGNTAGRALRERRSIITEGNTQVLIPLTVHDRGIGVLEIHSPFTGRFNESDCAGLEAVAQIFIDASDVKQLLGLRAPFGHMRASAPLEHIDPTSAMQARERLKSDTSSARPPLPISTAPALGVQTTTALTLRTVVMGFQRCSVKIAPLAKQLPPSLPGAALLAFAASLPPLLLRQTDALHGFAFVSHAIYGIFAIAVLGAAISTVRRLSIRNTAYFTTAYAVFLAMMQSPHGIVKSIPAGLLNVACGLIGGYLGGTIGRALRRRLQTRQTVSEVHRP